MLFFNLFFYLILLFLCSLFWAWLSFLFSLLWTSACLMLLHSFTFYVSSYFYTHSELLLCLLYVFILSFLLPLGRGIVVALLLIKQYSWGYFFMFFLLHLPFVIILTFGFPSFFVCNNIHSPLPSYSIFSSFFSLFLPLIFSCLFCFASLLCVHQVFVRCMQALFFFCFL